MTVMARTRKTAGEPPQSTGDIDLAKETITAAFTATVEVRVAELATARAEVLRLERLVADAYGRRGDWIDYGTIDEDRALDARLFASRDMHALARQVTTSPTTRLDPDEVQAARRKHEVVKRYLTDRNLLSAALVDPNWRPNR